MNELFNGWRATLQARYDTAVADLETARQATAAAQLAADEAVGQRKSLHTKLEAAFRHVEIDTPLYNLIRAEEERLAEAHGALLRAKAAEASAASAVKRLASAVAQCDLLLPAAAEAEDDPDALGVDAEMMMTLA